MKQKLLEMVQATVPIYFYFDEIKKIKKVWQKTYIFCKIGQSQWYFAITA